MEKKKYKFTMMHIIIILYTVFFIGFIIFFLGTPFNNKYTVENVAVYNINNSKIIIDTTLDNRGDTTYLEINKPFYVFAKKGDLISIRYPEDHKEKAYYVIDKKVGVIIMITSSITIMLICLIGIISFIKQTAPFIKGTKNR